MLPINVSATIYSRPEHAGVATQFMHINAVSWKGRLYRGLWERESEMDCSDTALSYAALALGSLGVYCSRVSGLAEKAEHRSKESSNGLNYQDKSA